MRTTWGRAALVALVSGLVAVPVCGAAVAKTTRASVSSHESEANGPSFNAFISADGRFVAFESNADDLVGNDAAGFRDVFVRDRRRGLTKRVSVSSSGAEANDHSLIYSNGSPISEDGRFVAFFSSSNTLVPGDLNGETDIFVRDRKNRTTRRVSIDSSEGEALHGDSVDPAISADGRFVVFASVADTLVPNDENLSIDVFIRDRKKGVTKRVSVNSSEAESHQGGSEASVSANGRYVLFGSTSDNLAPGVDDGNEDAYVRDRWKGTTHRVSVNSHEKQANASVGYMSISSSGRFVVFESAADNLVPHDTNGVNDVFIRDRREGTTRRVSVNSREKQSKHESGYAHISPSGRYVVFEAPDGNLVRGDDNGVLDIFVRDLRKGKTIRVTRRAGGSSPAGSEYPTITADGRFLTFQSDVTNHVEHDGNGLTDIFVRGPLR